jgi:hypothetical protein
MYIEGARRKEEKRKWLIFNMKGFNHKISNLSVKSSKNCA